MVVGIGYLMVLQAPDANTEGTSLNTLKISTDVSRTLGELKLLDNTITSSSLFFNSPAFLRLTNFTKDVPAQNIGRQSPDSPFVDPAWLVKMKANKTQANKSVANTVVTKTTTPATPAKPATPAIQPPAPTAVPGTTTTGSSFFL